MAGGPIAGRFAGQFAGHTVRIFVLRVLLAEQLNVVLSYRFVDHRDQWLLLLRLIAAAFLLLIIFGCFEIAQFPKHFTESASRFAVIRCLAGLIVRRIDVARPIGWYTGMLVYAMLVGGMLAYGMLGGC